MGLPLFHLVINQGIILSGQMHSHSIKTFNVSDNLFTGPIPNFTDGHATVNYANNQGLCGGSLGPCKPNASSKSNTTAIAGAAVGGVTLAALGMGIVMFFLVRRVSYRKEEADPEGNKWAKGAKALKLGNGTKKRDMKLFKVFSA